MAKAIEKPGAQTSPSESPPEKNVSNPAATGGAGNQQSTNNRLLCIKNLANAGSLQNAVGLGNATGAKGWLAGAFLGNNVSSALDLMQSLWNSDPSGAANGAGQAFGSNVAVAGGQVVANQVPNIVSVNINVAKVSVSTATATLSLKTTTATVQVSFYGSMARTATNTISGVFDFKLYADIGVALIADYLCIKDGN
jgi:hypothetical protein